MQFTAMLSVPSPICAAHTTVMMWPTGSWACGEDDCAPAARQIVVALAKAWRRKPRSTGNFRAGTPVAFAEAQHICGI